MGYGNSCTSLVVVNVTAGDSGVYACLTDVAGKDEFEVILGRWSW